MSRPNVILVEAVSIHKKIVFSILHSQAHYCYSRPSPRMIYTATTRPYSSKWRRRMKSREISE